MKSKFTDTEYLTAVKFAGPPGISAFETGCLKDFVEWALYPTFPSPVRRIYDRASKVLPEDLWLGRIPNHRAPANEG
jgi:hypothetical protein